MGSVQASGAPSDDPIVDHCLAVIVEPVNALSLPLSDYLSLCLSPSLPLSPHYLSYTHNTHHVRETHISLSQALAHTLTHTHTTPQGVGPFLVFISSAKLCSYIWLSHCLICTGKITYYGSLTLHKITLKYIAL